MCGGFSPTQGVALGAAQREVAEREFPFIKLFCFGADNLTEGARYLLQIQEESALKTHTPLIKGVEVHHLKTSGGRLSKNPLLL